MNTNSSEVDVLKEFINNFQDNYLIEQDDYESKFDNYKNEIQEEKISSPSPTNSLKFISRESSPINFNEPNYNYVCNTECLLQKKRSIEDEDKNKKLIWMIKCDKCLAYRERKDIYILQHKNKKNYYCQNNCNNNNHFVRCEKCKEIKIRKNMKKVLKEKIKIV